MSYEPHIEAFIATLGEPSYATPDTDPTQTVLLWGTYYGARTGFWASPDDLHDYGRDVYARAVAGEWGPIAPFSEDNAHPFGGRR